MIRWAICWATILFAAPAGAEPTRILLLGDSITRGVRDGVTEEDTFAKHVEADLKSQGFDVAITNAGVPGEDTGGALARIDKLLAETKPQLVTIMYGTNDSYVYPDKKTTQLTLDQYAQNLAELVRRVKQAGARPVLMTAPRWGAQAKPNGLNDNPNVQLEPFLDACRKLSRKQKLPLVDHYAHWLKAQEGGTNISTWTTDECHPNPAGHKILAEQITPTLAKLLKQR